VALAAPSRFALYPVQTHHVRWVVVAGVAVVALRTLSRDPKH
jgi:hypothetical protein